MSNLLKKQISQQLKNIKRMKGYTRFKDNILASGLSEMGFRR